MPAATGCPAAGLSCDWLPCDWLPYDWLPCDWLSRDCLSRGGLSNDALIKRTPLRHLEPLALRRRLRSSPTESYSALERTGGHGGQVLGEVRDGRTFALTSLKFFVSAVPRDLDRPHVYGRAWTVPLLPSLGAL